MTTERRILEVYAGEDVRGPNPNDPTDKGETIKGFYVITYLERDGVSVDDSQMPVGCSVDVEVALDTAVMAAKEGWAVMGDVPKPYDEVRFMGLEATSIHAECHTDDYAFKYEFDAAPWFEQATDEQIIALANCGWGGDYPADAVAEYQADHDDRLRRLFDYLAVRNKGTGEDVGFECSVAAGDADRWLSEHRPLVLALLDGVIQ